jgi:Ca-activated chloride channel family protein
LEIRYHYVDVTIEDQIAITRVDQVFYNPNDWMVEGTYVFPIPRDAVVTNFKLWIDGEPVQGEVLSVEEARRTYESIVREMQDPALLEYADRGAVQARIFPIDPGSERRIQLEYTQALTAEDGLVRYVYPLNTEKFSTQPLEEVRVTVDIRASQPIRAVYSPSHPVAVSRVDDFNVTAGYEEANVRPDTDFALFYSIGESEAFHLLSYIDPDDPADPDGYFLALLAPRPDAAAQPVPKNVILVLDRSGSMEGEKFMQAQEALKYILRHLNPEDRFNVISFSTGLETYARDLRETSEANEAVAWVDRQSAVGSTDINRALLEAAAMADAERPTYLIFLTDGLPTEGVTESNQILNNFAANAPNNLRLFAFGVGYDVDTFLLDSLTQEHHGTSTYVLPGEPLDEILSSFYAKVSTPVLMDLALNFWGITVYDLYPNPLPDLFAGSQIVVVGRYREGGTTDVTLSGTVNGQVHSFTFPNQNFVTDSPVSGHQSSIPRLWATRKIGYLLHQIRLQGPAQELIDQIVRLSIRYGIVTPYTSYLVTEPMPLGAVEQERIAKEVFSNMKSAPAAPSYGKAAVEQAADEGAMREADAISAPPAEVANLVRIVGSRTFVFSDGVWVDTAFDPDVTPTVKIAFLSDDYFALVTADPQLGAGFALGSKVIALSNGIAYEVVAADFAVPAVEIPKSQLEPTSTPATQPAEAAGTPETEAEPPAAGESTLCVSGILPLALFPLAGLVLGRTKRKKCGYVNLNAPQPDKPKHCPPMTSDEIRGNKQTMP